MSFGAERQRETAASAPKAKGCCTRPKNKTGQLKKGCPVFGFHIINLHKADIKQVRKAGSAIQRCFSGSMLTVTFLTIIVFFAKQERFKLVARSI